MREFAISTTVGRAALTLSHLEIGTAGVNGFPFADAIGVERS